MSSFQARRADVWRWVGDALLLGDIPIEGRTPLRMLALGHTLELGFDASDSDIRAELARFKTHGHRRGA
jgi:hypothetical protein